MDEREMAGEDCQDHLMAFLGDGKWEKMSEKQCLKIAEDIYALYQDVLTRTEFAYIFTSVMGGDPSEVKMALLARLQ